MYSFLFLRVLTNSDLANLLEKIFEICVVFRNAQIILWSFERTGTVRLLFFVVVSTYFEFNLPIHCNIFSFWILLIYWQWYMVVFHRKNWVALFVPHFGMQTKETNFSVRQIYGPQAWLMMLQKVENQRWKRISYTPL